MRTFVAAFLAAGGSLPVALAAKTYKISDGVDAAIEKIPNSFPITVTGQNGAQSYTIDEVTGTLIFADLEDGGLKISGKVMGLRKNVANGGSLSIRQGTSCVAPENVQTGAYLPDGLSKDPLLGSIYSTDSEGTAEFSIEAKDYSLDGEFPVAGMIFVMSDADTMKDIACGIIPAYGTKVVMANFPSYSTTITKITGYLEVLDALLTGATDTSMAESGITIKGVLSGLTQPLSYTNEPGLVHVHEGTVCSNAGGHYVPEGMTEDPWTGTYTVDADGKATFDLKYKDFSMSGSNPVGGRIIVLHANNNEKTPVACGVIPASGIQVNMGPALNYDCYQDGVTCNNPGQSEATKVSGYMTLSDKCFSTGGPRYHFPTCTGIAFDASKVTGLPPSVSAKGRIAIHQGTSCTAVGDQFVPAGMMDEQTEGAGTEIAFTWKKSYTTDATGKLVEPKFIVDPSEKNSFTMRGMNAVVGKTVVIYDVDGVTQLACGVIPKYDSFESKSGASSVSAFAALIMTTVAAVSGLALAF
jgi:hypothetical protein